MQLFIQKTQESEGREWTYKQLTYRTEDFLFSNEGILSCDLN